MADAAPPATAAGLAPRLDDLPCGVLSFDDEGTVVAVNAALLSMLDLERAAVEGRHVERLLTVGGRIFFQTHLFPLVRLQGHARELFVLLRRGDGGDVAALVNAVRREHDGRPVTDCVLLEVRERRRFEDALVRARDVAEAARAELERRTAELELLNERLEQQAVELELQQQQLVDHAAALEAQSDELHAMNDALLAGREELEQARAAADDANRAKSEFLAVMSHELRTPLNAIGGYAELLELGVYGPVTEAQTGTLARIVGSQRHLLRLVNEVLNLARIEAGRVDYAREAVRVAEVVAAVAPMLEPQMAAAGLALRTVVPAELAACGDRDKVQQILINLLTNAVKFTPEGGAVTVSAERDAAGEQVLVRVADTGVGIPPEKWTTVFEPFVQVQASHAGRREGTGLGLSISRDLARGMGGDLLLRSAVGEGSTFTLVLPAD